MSEKSKEAVELDVQDLKGTVEAIGRSQAMIEFEMDGTIITANDNFLNAMGYTLDEVQGQHHSMFAEPGYVASQEYKAFWKQLNRGIFDSGEYRRLGKGGKEVWIQASYNPILDADDNPYKVVKFAVDITEQKKNAEQAAKLAATLAASNTAVMVANLDLEVTYANEATLRLVKSNIGEFQAAFPGVNFSNLIGVCVDVFHKNPSYQRQLLGNPNNLPHQADIQVGSLTFALNINAMYDSAGKHIGCSLEWQNVTQMRKAATRAEALFSQIQGASAYFMTCDQDLNVTYVNPSLQTMFRKYAAEMRATLPAFNPEDIMGKCIDLFHKVPSHQRQVLGNPKALPATVEIKVGRLEFQVTATALYDDKGNHIGSGAEWADLNDRAAYRDEVNSVIKACNDGDLSYRGDASKLSKEFAPMMDGINNIIDAIVAPINEASGILERVAQRDLTARITGDYQGDHAKIKNNLNTAVEALEDAMTQAREASIQVTSAGQQISTGSQTLAQGASEQASSLEEISASLEELTAMTNQNSDNAAQASTLSDEAKNISDKGIAAMNKMSEAINMIQQSAEKTGRIVKTIDEIAFQTNLLALNAAVEAARAGDAGKGFAVVAEEVRSLAARSAEAARDTSQLIEQSGKNAEGGVRISEEVAQALNEIQAQTVKVADLMAEIAAGSKEQASGISQINDGVTQLDSVTQKNAANSEESAAAAEELSAQAQSLAAMISSFRLSNVGNSMGYGQPQQRAPQNYGYGNGNGYQGMSRPGAPARAAMNPNDIIPMGNEGLMEF